MKLPYREGTWFAVPLRQGGFGVGVVARATAKGKVILCYFFGQHRTAVPALGEVRLSKPHEAVNMVRVGDLSLIRGEWPVIGEAMSWKRSDWPMPPFVRRDKISDRAWRVLYSDIGPLVIACEMPEVYDRTLECDAMLGSGAAEVMLTKLLM